MKVTKFSCVLCLLGLAVTGCTATTQSLVADAKRSVEKVTKQHPPVARIVCLWEPAEGQAPDGTPARGCAGNILFFTARKAEPIEVRGKVEIYQFDDQGTAEEQAQPLYKFTFGPGAWDAHISEGALGVGYSVFVPYMRKSRYETRCSLKMRFTPEDGRTPVYSNLDSVTLPGPDNPRGLFANQTSQSLDMGEIIAAGLKDLGREGGVAPEIKAPKAPANGLRTLTIPTGGELGAGK